MALGTRVQFEQLRRPSGPLVSSPALSERLSEAIDRGVNYLLSLQATEGYWVGELEADTTLESDYIFYLNVIGKAQSRPHRQAGELCAAAAARRWRLEYLFWRAVRAECHGQGVCGAEAGGRFARLRAPAARVPSECMNWAAWKRRIPIRGFIWRWWGRSDGTWFRRSRRS